MNVGEIQIDAVWIDAKAYGNETTCRVCFRFVESTLKKLNSDDCKKQAMDPENQRKEPDIWSKKA